MPWPKAPWSGSTPTREESAPTLPGSSSGVMVTKKNKKRLAKARKLPESSSIKGMILCLWDNVSGPRTEQVWEGKEPLDPEMLKYICRYTLGGEVSLSTADQDDIEQKGNLQAKFHMLPQYDFIVSGVVFPGKFYNRFTGSNDTATKWSLCIFVDREQLSRYLQLHPIFEDHLIHLSSMIQWHLNSKAPGETIDLLDTRFRLFVEQCSILMGIIAPQADITKTYFTVKCPLGKDFLTRAITSHLQTQSSSVIVGGPEDIEKVNCMINTLLLFVPEKDKSLCSHVSTDSFYVPGLMIQGIIGEFDRTKSMHSLFPTTVIDIGQKHITQLTVRQHSKARDMFKKYEIESSGDPDKSFPELLKDDLLFRSVKETSSLVHNFMLEIMIIPLPLRASLITHFNSHIKRKTVVVLRCVESCSSDENKRMVYLRRIKSILHLNEADFLLVMAIAEKIRPGISTLMFGTGQEDLEKRFSDMWGVG